MSSLLFADGTEADDNFIVHQGDDAFIDVYALDRTTKASRDITVYPEIIFELEGVEFQVIKTKSAGQITHTASNVARIPLDAADTQGLHGLYTIQLRLVNDQGKRETVLSGTGRFDREIFGSVAA